MVSVASHGHLLGGKVVGHRAHEVGRGQVAEARVLGIHPTGQPVLTFCFPLARVCWTISTCVTHLLGVSRHEVYNEARH